MSWTQALLEECYPIGSLWWMFQEGDEEDYLVKVDALELGAWGRPTISVRRLSDDSLLEVDGNADPPILEGPVSPLESLADQAE